MKLDGDSSALDRRSLLAAAVAGSALGASGAAAFAAAPAPIADAHLHLFNGSDLPVGKFLRYVYLPDQFPQLPPWLDAVADIGVNVIKRLAITARREAGKPAFAEALISGSDVTPEAFGRVLGDYVAEGSKSPGALTAGAPPFDPALAASYRALVKEISGGPVGFAEKFSTDPLTKLPALKQEDRAVLRATFTAVARFSAAPAPPSGGANLLGYLDPFTLLGAAGRTVGWLYLMCRSRQTHLDVYLRDWATPAMAPRLVVNHLVDYDRWLDDGPSKDSPHLEQVALMATLAKRNHGKVDLRTFAGVCPLKNVLETALNPGAPTTLKALQDAYDRGDVAGFKIYPPMGFQPYDNTALADEAFERPPGDDVVLKQWRAVSQDRLGPALDKALMDFYVWCADRDAPLMAHGGPGNQAAPGFGDRANPKYWEAAQKRLAQQGKTLRLNIGHLVHDAGKFIDAVNKGPPYPVDVWALDASVRMLGAGPKGTIYGDLAFMPELIDNAKLRTDFFTALRSAFGKHDPDLRHILYGTDWILMALQNHNTRFLDTIIGGMTDAGYTEVQKTNILSANARRFLKIDPAT